MEFEKKQLAQPERVCYRLKTEREARHITLEELSRRTKITKRHLQALEECRFQDIPYASIYQKNFVKYYVQALGLPSESFTEQFTVEELSRVTAKKTAVTPPKQKKFTGNLPYILRSLGIGLTVVACVIYLGLQVKSIVEPPRLTLYSPLDGQVTSLEQLNVRGETDNEATVSINGQNIKTDGSGTFNEPITLSAGLNTITIASKKKHGKETSTTRHVILKEGQQFSLNK